VATLEVEGSVILFARRFVLIARRSNLNHRMYLVPVVMALAFATSGCGEKQLPETEPGSSRAMIENPLGKAADNKPAKVSSKAKAAYEKSAGNDPRGK